MSPMHMIVAVFFDEPAFDDNPFDQQHYRTAFRQFGDMLAARGMTMAIVRGAKTYIGGNAFDGAWIYRNGDYERTDGTLVADVILNRGLLQADANATVVNEPAFDELCTIKSKTYDLFPEFFPKTMLVRDDNDAAKFLASIGSEKAVAKPLDGQEGIGVMILPKAEFPAKIPSYPYLLQEFIDTSEGIPGITDTVHDFRIVSIRGVFATACVRTAPKGQWLANVAQGGTLTEVKEADVPPDAMAIFRAVDARLHAFPDRMYSVDVARDKSGEWKIIELNSMPGLGTLEEGPGAKRSMEMLTEMLFASIKQDAAIPV